jgi:putative inorganic carbon (HCO3(-)) transporter
MSTYLGKIKVNYTNILLLAILTAVSVGITYLMANVNMLVGPIIVVLFLGCFLLVGVFMNYRFAIYACFFISVFMSYANRIYPSPVPMGVVLDALAALAFIAIFFDKAEHDWKLVKAPITVLYTIIVVYQMLQVFNPNAMSFVGWAVALRGNTSFLLFFVFFHMFADFNQVKKFTYLWLGLAAAVAIYGIFQEVIGLTEFEKKWVYQSEGRVQLLFIWGHMRKFSFLSDPSAFGLFTGFSGLGCLVLAVGPYNALQRIAAGGLAGLCFISMSFSGTRTAIVMVAFGVAFYIMLTIQTRTTIIFTIITVLGAGALLFGPFYGSTLNRIRSTFNMEGDASMNVRDKKRIRLQTYVRAHPFGGGLNTTGTNGLKYSPGHPLAEGWDPDSGYLLIGLELGWIGLIIGLSFFFAVVTKGINNYFALDDPLLKNVTLAYIVPFMALSVAHFAQDAVFQKPVYLVVTATYALMLRMPSYEKQLKNNPS